MRSDHQRCVEVDEAPPRVLIESMRWLRNRLLVAVPGGGLTSSADTAAEGCKSHGYGGLRTL